MDGTWESLCITNWLKKCRLLNLLKTKLRLVVISAL